MAKITVAAKPDAIETVKAELLKMVPLTRQEPGCLEYRLHQDRQNPALFVFYENCESFAFLEDHMISAHFQSYVATVGNLIAEKVVSKLTEIA